MGTKNLNSATDLITFTRASGGTALRKISYGSELVTNGDFDTDSDWTLGDGWTISGGVAVGTNTFRELVSNTATVIAGRTYIVTFEITSYTAGRVKAKVGSTLGTYRDSVGVYTEIITATNTDNARIVRSDLNFTGSIDNVSVKEVFYDQPDGTLQLFNHPDNVPRIEYNADGTVKGLLIEEARTNRVTHSNNFTAWSSVNGGVNPAKNVTGLDGLTSAWTLTDASTSNRSGISFANSSSETGTFTASVFVKKDNDESRFPRINFYTPAGASISSVRLNTKTGALFVASATNSLSSVVEDIGDFWRVSLGFTDLIGANKTIRIFPADSNTIDGTDSNANTGSIVIFGAQLEQGSFPTSYIPTTGATATRAADIVSIPVADFGYNDDAGSLVIDYDTPNIQVSDRLLSLSTGFVNRVFDISLSGTDFINYSDASGQINLGSLTSTGKVAVAFESAKEFVGVKDGAVITVDPTTTAVTRPETLYIGTWFTTSDRFPNGHIKSIKYYPRRLSNAQLQELTT